MIWLPLLKRFGPAIAVLVCLAVAYGAHRKAVNTSYRAGYQAAEATMNARVIEANARTAARDAEARKTVEENERDHQKALSVLGVRYATTRLPPVRLCPPAARSGELPASAGSTALDPGAAAADGLPGRDLGPDLERIARQADEQTVRLLACQAYVRSVQSLPTTTAQSE